MDESVEEEMVKVEEGGEEEKEEGENGNHGNGNDEDDDDDDPVLPAGQAQNSRGEEDDEGEASSSNPNSDSDSDRDIASEGWGSQVECKVEISCPFCSFRPGAAGSHIEAHGGVVSSSVPSSATSSPPPSWSQQSQRLVASLLVHLDNAHLHFCFFPALDFNGHLHISVVRNRSEDLSSWKLRSLKFEPHLAQSSKHHRNRLVRLDCSHWPLIDLPDSCSSRDDSGGESGDDEDDDEAEDDSDDDDDDDDDYLMDVSAEAAAGGDPEVIARLLQEAKQRGSRGYYNARVGTRVTRVEEPVPQCAYDVGNLWTRRREQGIDSFVSQDLKGEEKDFIKMWNAFMSERKVVDGSSRFSVACVQFVLARHQDIFRLNLRFMRSCTLST